MPTIISIEGNIGSGKSTFITNLNDSLGKHYKICFLQEPVDEWNTIKDQSGETILTKFYRDSKSYAFSFQMMAYISRLSLLRNALREDYDIIITERCVETDKMVFAKMLYDDDKIEDIEYSIYNKWFQEFISDIPKIKTIYLKTDPAVAKKRVDKRARQGETIPLEYLSLCHEYHEKWLNEKDSDDVVTIDVNCDTDTNSEVLQEWIETAEQFINRTNVSSKHLDLELFKHTLMFDGGSRNNPGICGAGHVILENDEVISSESSLVSTYNTNNYAEYTALINGLDDAIKRGISCLLVKGDSKLVINQVTGKWFVKKESLKKLHGMVLYKITLFEKIKFVHIARKYNALADANANKAIDNYLSAMKE